MNFPKKQLQLSQLELIFKGPLVKDSIVNSLSDLTNFNVNYNFEHKSVWVKDEEANYYLFSGDGSEISHWKREISRLVIEQYKANETWSKDTVVYLGGKIYKAKQDVPINYNPLDYENYWLLIAGDSVTYRYIFNNVSSIIIYTDIKNPIFEVILGTFEFDSEGSYVIDSNGLIKLNNQEIVEAYIEKREDLVDNNGSPYEISFEENSLPVLLTGVVNVK